MPRRRKIANNVVNIQSQDVAPETKSHERFLCRIYAKDKIVFEKYFNDFQDALVSMINQVGNFLDEDPNPIGIIFDYVPVGWRPVLRVGFEDKRLVTKVICPSRHTSGLGLYPPG